MWRRPWRHATGSPRSVPRTSRPRWPGADGAGQPGSSANGMPDRVGDLVGEAAETRAEDEPEHRHERCVPTDARFEHVEPRGETGRTLGHAPSPARHPDMGMPEATLATLTALM